MTIYRQILIYLFFTISQVCLSQTNDADLTIMVGCGFAGQTDSEFNEYANYINNKEYETLKKNLNSSRLFDQLLSAISLDELSSQGKIHLTDSEKETILKIKKEILPMQWLHRTLQR